MGVFSITPRSETLKTSEARSPVRQVHTPNRHVADTTSEWRGMDNLGRGMQDLGRSMFAIAADMARERNMIQDAETETAFIDAMRAKMEAPETGLLGRVRMAGNSDALQECVTEGQEYFKSAAEELLKDKGYSGRRKEKMMLRLREAASPFERAMSRNVLGKTQELKVAAADGNFDALLNTWRSHMTDEDATKSVIDSYRASQRVRGLPDDAVNQNADRILRGMAGDFVLEKFRTLPDEAAVDEHIQTLKADEKALLAGNGPLAAYFGGKDVFDPKAKEALVGALEERRREIARRDRAAVDMVLNEGMVAAMAVQDKDGRYPADRLARIEDAMDKAANLAETMPKGSAAAAHAATGAAKLDALADKVCQYEIMDKLAAGDELTRDGGKTSTFPPSSRATRIFPKVYAAWNDQRRKEFNKGFRAARDQNLLVADAAMMDFVARGNPQGFYDYLAQAVVDKKLTPGDFERLRDRFNDGWMKGFKGAPDQMSKQAKMAKDMLDAIKDKLGVDMSTAIKTNDFGDPAIRNGALDWDEKAELPDASVRREFKKTVRHGDIFFSFGSDTATRKEKIESQQLKEALNEAMKLWSSDGLKIEHDPVTGERLPEGKTHTVNAVEDFKALLGRLADERNILSAADTLKQQSAYAANVRLFAAAEANRRTERMTKSKPVTDGQIEEKNDNGE